MFHRNRVSYLLTGSVLLSIFIGCTTKEEKTTSVGDSSAIVIKKDSVTGKQKVQLKYVVKKGDMFSYKMTAKTSTSENSPATEGKDVKQDNEINYFYTKDAQDIDKNGIITYKVKYDSIIIQSSMEDRSIKYNSNINDSVRNNPAFVQYNAVVNENFYLRVSAEGEITDVYGLEQIYENLFKALGDTLKEEDKQTIKDSFGKESIKEVLQQEYQMFPKYEIPVDSTWVKSYNTTILFFDIVNNAKYTLKSIEERDGKKIANIEAQLIVEFLTKETKQRGVKFKIENAHTGGSGKIAFDLMRGCITNKETATNLTLDLQMSAQGQSAKSKQGVSTNLHVTLLN
jgi:uncharacterized protein DUF6263